MHIILAKELTHCIVKMIRYCSLNCKRPALHIQKKIVKIHVPIAYDSKTVKM